MNRTFLTTVLGMVILQLEAQITIMTNAPEKPKYEDKYVYDSLKNMTSPKYLVGQTLLFCGDYYYDGHIASNKTTGAPLKDGEYYKVEKDLPDLPGEAKNARMLVSNVKTGETTEDALLFSEENNFRWVVVGYYKKIKSLYLGKEFVYMSQYTRISPINMDTGVKTTVDDKSVWKCIDVQVKPREPGDNMEYMDFRCPIVLVFDNPQYGKHYAYFEDKHGGLSFTGVSIAPKGGKRLVCGMFQPKADFDYAQVQKQKKKAALIKKYGAKTAKDIMDGIIRTGMTEAMCRESWGNPDRINRTITSYGTSEQWVYGSDYVYFENGRITAIQD